MLKRLIKILIVLLLSIVFIGSVTLAQDNDGSQNGDRPPGWDKGKREGWRSDVPPGQEEKEKKEKEKKKKKKNITDEDEASEDEQLKKEKKAKKEKKEKKGKKGKQSKK